MLTYQEAYDLTASDLDDEARAAAARALQAGSAANDVYWNHVDDLTALKARAAGHGAPPPTDPEDRVSGATAELPAAKADAEATAVEDRSQVTQGSADPNVAAVARLRKQLTDAGLSPEA